MKNISLLLILLIPIVGMSQDNWQIIDGGQERIGVNIYESPDKSIDTLLFETDTIYLTSWETNVIDTSHGNTYYSISSSIYPSSYVNSDSTFSLIEGFLNSTVAEIEDDEEFELILSSLDLIDGYPGKKYKYKLTESNVLIEKRSYLIENQLLELVVITKPDRWFNKSIDRFFSSLRLIDRKKNENEYGFTIIKSPSYKIEFPKEPTEQNKFIDSELGKLNMRIQILERDLKVGNVVFMSSETRYPGVFKLDKEEEEEFYNESIRGSLNSTNAKLVERKKIKIKDDEGVEYITSMFDGAVIGIYRTIYVEGTVYVHGVITTEKVKNEEVESFFSSFEKIQN